MTNPPAREAAATISRLLVDRLLDRPPAPAVSAIVLPPIRPGERVSDVEDAAL
ncbi:MAG TPA: hypothetical protein VN796_07755 [Acidimicrobiales bacterium]|nr:hypothetical protein [Acidimicrobiales bacterium]